MSVCYYCPSQVQRKSSLCSNLLCFQCQYNPYCQTTSVQYASKDENFQQFYRHPICRICISKTLQITKLVIAYQILSYRNPDQVKSYANNFDIQYKLLAHSQKSLLQWLENPKIEPQECIFIIFQSLNSELLFKIQNLVKNQRVKIIIKYTSQVLPYYIGCYQDQNKLFQAVYQINLQGQILVTYSDLFKIYTEETFQQDLQENLRRKILQGAQIQENYQIFWINYDVLSLDLLNCLIKHFQSLGLIPFMSRIKQTLQSLFNLNESLATIIELAMKNSLKIGIKTNPEGLKEQYIKYEKKVDQSALIHQLKAISQDSIYQLKNIVQSNSPFTSLLLNAKYFSSCFELPILLSQGAIYLLFKAPSRIPPYLPNLKIQPNKILITTVESLIPHLQKILEKPEITLEKTQQKLRILIYPKILSTQNLGFTTISELLLSIPQFKNHPLLNLELKECPICYVELQEDTSHYACKHLFHLECLQKQIDISKRDNLKIKCPACNYRPKKEEIDKVYKGFKPQILDPAPQNENFGRFDFIDNLFGFQMMEDFEQFEEE